MQRRNFVLGTLWSCCAVTALYAGPFGFGKKPEAEIKWQTDIVAAHKLSMAQNKPMLVVFGADWCTWCKKLEKEILAHPELTQYINDSFIPVHLDADKDEKVLEILKVKGLPCSVILSPEADELSRIEGYQQASTYFEKLSSARQQFQKVQALKRE